MLLAVDVFEEIRNRVTPRDMENYLGEPIAKGNVLCWLHNDHNPSMHLFKDGYYCPVCFNDHTHKRISVIDRYMQKKSCNRAQAIREINGIFNLGLTLDGDIQEKPSAVDFTGFYKKAAQTFVKSERAQQYWISRGFSIESAKKYDIGYFINESQTETRLLFPYSNCFYNARLVDGEGPKYRRPSTAAGARWTPYLINLYESDDKPIFITEGEINALSLVECGARAVATTSTGNVRKFLEYLDKHPGKWRFILAYDLDEAGRTAQQELAEGLRKRGIPFIERAEIAGNNGDINDRFRIDAAGLRDDVARAIADAEKAEAPKIEKKKLRLYSGKEMDETVFPEPVWAIEKLLPREGAGMIYASPKSRKSWLTLQAACAIAEGETFLGFQTVQSDVLYFSLEMHPQLIQERVRQLRKRKGGHFPAGLTMAYKASNLDNGFLDELESALSENPSIKVVFVDMFVHIRGESRRGESVYTYDYREMTALKDFATDHGILIIVVHHTRKGFDADSLGRISGSNGLVGAADLTWFICLKSRKDNTHGSLEINGKRIREANTYTVHIDALTAEFVNDGIESDDGFESESDDLVALIEAVATDALWRGNAKKLKQLIQEKCGIELDQTPQQLYKELERCRGVLADKGISLEAVQVTGAGRDYLIRRCVSEHG